MDTQQYLIAVSGGVDSCYLLHWMQEQGHQGVVCHVNHGLRPESAQEAVFVRGLAAQYGLPYEECTLQMAAQDGAFEADAREARLRFYARIARQRGVQHVALGHHADDQAETILMQLCRGSASAHGMQELTELTDYGITLWRPLLRMRKAEIVAWMQARDLSWHEDASNQQPIAVRNRIRHEVMPLLCDIFSRDVAPLIGRQVSTAESEIDELLPLIPWRDPQGRLFLPRVRALSPALQARVLLHYLREEGVQEVSTAKLTESLSLLTDPTRWKVNLPGDRHLRRKEQRLIVE